MFDISKLVSPVYISGPITGVEDGNKENFDRIALYLESQGLCTVNPRRNPIPNGVTFNSPNFWKVMMQESLRIMMDCNSIVLLNGWVDSKGACLEEDIAYILDWPIAEEN
mgnify:CR=1 FL=1|jgi:hypothetical protein